MPHPVGKKEESRARILASAGRGFRSQGYGALGVDGLAKAAGVTSGAFYAHFRSKAQAFREAVVVGLQDLRAGIELMRASGGAGWRRKFVDFYLGDRRTCELGDSCALQSLTAEVARAEVDVREAFETEFRKIVDATAAGLEGATAAERRSEATSLLALLVGGVSLARAVQDPQLSNEIAEAVRSAAARLEREKSRPRKRS
jgi:AcrR family transcriptional regulator